MEINLTLHGILRDHLPRSAKGKTSLTVPAGFTVAEVIAQFGLKQSITAAIDGVRVAPDRVLQNGDHLQLFRMVGGGSDAAG